jgi:hypothetical protein
MLGFLIPILITVYVYKQAKENGRNAVLWSVINIAVIIGVQLLIGITIGIAVALGTEFLGWEEDSFEKWSIGINLLAVVASLVCSYFFVVRTVTRIPDEQFNGAPPPPPPQFN